MDIYEYQERLKKAVADSLTMIACDECKARYLAGHVNAYGKAYSNALRCESCAFLLAAPIEKLVLERAHSLVGRHAEIVVQAWRRLKAPAADVKDIQRNWDTYLLAHDQGTGKDPQEIRGDRCKENRAAFEELGKALKALDEAMPKTIPMPAENES
jgi:hypothetical protein